MIISYALAVLGGYMAGSIPFGLVLTRLAGYGDIRTIGSGNIGATNVLRTGNKPLALAVLILDSGKGAAAVLALEWFFGGSTVLLFLCAVAAIIGHCFPIWLGFKGGKGVATTLGTVLAASPIAGLVACATWLAVAAVFRISSLAALVAIVTVPVSVFFLHGGVAAGIAAVIALLVFIRHKDNIKRILNGNEPRIGKKKTDEKPVSTAENE